MADENILEEFQETLNEQQDIEPVRGNSRSAGEVTVNLIITSNVDAYFNGEVRIVVSPFEQMRVFLQNYPDNTKLNAGYFGRFDNLTCYTMDDDPQPVAADTEAIGKDIVFYHLCTQSVYGVIDNLMDCTLSGEDGKLVNDGTYNIKITRYYGPSDENPSDPIDDGAGNSVSAGYSEITVPAIKALIPAELAVALNNAGYKKARAVVVYPNPQDRKVVCQGVATPTLYTENHRGMKTGGNEYPLRDLFAQSSWFFRPVLSLYYTTNPDTNSPSSGDNMPIPYMDNGEQSSPADIKRVEIQGHFKSYNKFKTTWKTLTMHSPDVEFDSGMSNLDFSSKSLQYSLVGHAKFTKTLSDIDIQTETPTISDKGSGFEKKTFVRDSSDGIISGLFWDDYGVDDGEGAGGKFEAFRDQKASAKWMVYLWNKKGSLNNDIERPADQGVRSAVLKQKIISNLRYAKTVYTNGISYNCSTQLYNSDVADMIKLKDISEEHSNLYKGNVDTMLLPDSTDGMYFTINYAYIQTDIQQAWNIDGVGIFVSPDFLDDVNYKTFVLYKDEETQESDEVKQKGLFNFKTDTRKWMHENSPFDRYIGDGYLDLLSKKEGVRLQYKSTPHIVMVNKGSRNAYTDTEEGALPVFEVQRDISDTVIFGGTSDDALKENIWIPCGEPVRLDHIVKVNGEWGVPMEYSWGDTYFQRWDCLKTYAFTPEDINQVVEIGSFMLESYINIDGRYDRNRGQLNNLYMSPRNFNLLNPVYSQINNFFSYRRLDEDAYKRKWYPNQITWSKTKTSGAEVDLWTNVTLASVIEMDGDKGTIRKLIRQNNELFSFQDKGIAQVLYNQNVQISATNGTPIEIANSGKVDGKRYYTDSVGCSNKWSMTQTPMGIYFMDSLNKDIFLFNGQLQNLSGTLGFNSWAKQNIPAVTDRTRWTPNRFRVTTDDNGSRIWEQGFDNFVSYQDKLNQDVLFINHDTALAYSEKFGVFTSFYDYGDTPFFCNLDDMGIWVQNTMENGVDKVRLWQHNAGDYCSFFQSGTDKTYNPYWTVLIGNPEPQMDKIFTNLEFRASVDGDGELKNEAGKFSFTLPFDFLETWDEYQHGYTALSERDGHDASLHHTNDNISSLKRKFRMWRCDIPRNNCLLDADRIPGLEYSTDAELGVSRHIRKPNDRMRNPWLYLKLMKQGDTSNRTEIHDLLMTYFV